VFICGGRLVSRQTEGKVFVDWSPNGEQILVQTEDAPYITQIYAVDGAADPQTITAFAELDSPLIGLDWSPDGKYLAMSGNSRLVVYEIATESWVFLTHENLYFSEPDWSPDGSEIAFRAHTTASGNSSIYIVNLFDNRIERLTEGADDYQPKWRPVPGVTPLNIGLLFERLWEASQ
jgi:WD40 repeat protein